MTNDEDAPFRPWSFVMRHSRFIESPPSRRRLYALAPTHVLDCGTQQLIDDAQLLLVARGVDQEVGIGQVELRRTRQRMPFAPAPLDHLLRIAGAEDYVH